MKVFGLALLGFLAALLSLTLFAPVGFVAIGALYCILLYLLFFTERTAALTLLLGVTIGLELLSTHRFGSVSLVSLIVYGSYLLFGLQLRFTAPYIRFLTAMTLCLLAAMLVLYPLTGFFFRLGPLVVVGIVIGLSGIPLQRYREASHHELL